MLKAETFEQLVEEGVAREELDSERHKLRLDAMIAQARRARITAHRVPEWTRTCRATFFDFPFPSSGKLRLVAPLLDAAIWVPEGLVVANEICDDARRFADKYDIPELRPVFNRIGINYLHGKMSKPAVIEGHTDPEEEKAFIAVMSVAGTAEGACDRPAVIGLYAGAELCRALSTSEHSVKQAFHGVCANEYRMAYTFVDFRA